MGDVSTRIAPTATRENFNEEGNLRAFYKVATGQEMVGEKILQGQGKLK